MKTFKLDNENKINSGFKVPDNYFDHLLDNVTQKISEEAVTKKTIVIPLFKNKRNLLLTVAAILVLALMIPVFYQNNSKKTELDSATLENYLALETPINELELIEEIETTNTIANENNLEAETLEDVLLTNSNIEQLIIED